MEKIIEIILYSLLVLFILIVIALILSPFILMGVGIWISDIDTGLKLVLTGSILIIPLALAAFIFSD